MKRLRKLANHAQRHLFSVCAWGLVSFLSFASVNAQANARETLRLCNKNPNINPMYVAFGYVSDVDDPHASYYQDVITQGWYKINFGKCYYYAAESPYDEIMFYVDGANYGDSRGWGYYCVDTVNAFLVGSDLRRKTYFYNMKTGSSASTCGNLGSSYKSVKFGLVPID